jgi:peroxiredoxin (alkyl hydroperoxide reductase subunit C)
MSTYDPNVLPPDLPAPEDDGAADHLWDMPLPPFELGATDGSRVRLDRMPGRVVVYAYPRTGRPDEPHLVPDWDQIPGARGCTPESCAFRDHFRDLRAAGASLVFGLSTQDTEYQREAAERLHLPFALLSDADLEMTKALRLPTFEAAGQTLLKRFTLIISDARIEHVFYPVFPPDGHAEEVLGWLGGELIE